MTAADKARQKHGEGSRRGMDFFGELAALSLIV
jgi:hypothetical protein